MPIAGGTSKSSTLVRRGEPPPSRPRMQKNTPNSGGRESGLFQTPARGSQNRRVGGRMGGLDGRATQEHSGFDTEPLLLYGNRCLLKGTCD